MVSKSLISCPISYFSVHHGDVLAVSFKGKEVSYRTLHQRVCRAQLVLRSEGFGAGDVACVVAERSLETIVLLFAGFRERIQICLLSDKLPELELERRVDEVGGRFVGLGEGLGLGEVYSEMLSLDQIGTLLYTSGSTGKAKVCVHALATHYFSALGSQVRLPVGIGDGWLLNLPLCHVSGVSILWRCFLHGGTVVMDGELGDVAFASMVPTQLKRLVDAGVSAPKRLKGVLLGGASVNLDLFEQGVALGYPIFRTYGMSEMGSQVWTEGTLPYSEVRVDDEGRIWVRGESLFLGYLRAGEIVLELDAEGWFLTGDLGEIVNGELRVLGRRDRVIISGGENIDLSELENLILGMAGVSRVRCEGVKDETFGMRPVAYVDADVMPSLEDVNQEILWSMASYNKIVELRAFLSWI